MTDQELIARLREGDHIAFEAIFRAHYAYLVGVGDSMLRDKARAEEIVQDVLLQLWRLRESFTLESTLRAYLHRATRNRVLNEVRHERIVQRTAPYVAVESAVEAVGIDTIVEGEIDVAVREAIATLPERCRQVFELSRFDGLKYAEIAESLGISVKTVEAQMGKALRLLRERLAGYLPRNDEI
jgi:RNA polymerase sigma-70 factor, ECF subfamily